MITAITEAVKEPSKRQEAVDFFRDEYTLDQTIALMKKPVVSFMDGATSEPTLLWMCIYHPSLMMLLLLQWAAV